jgi:predicted AAA+ superfamily ATPase
LVAYERQLGHPFEDLDKPLILFCDESQYDPQCIDTLQSLMNRSDKIFIFLSGSPLLKNQIVLDSRIVHQKIYPVSSPEYIKITKKKFQIPGLGESIRDALLFSENSAALFASLQSIAPEVNTYYKGSLQSDFYRYFCYGSLPNLLASENESDVYESTQRTIDRILYKDLPSYSFHPDTVALIPSMLFDLSVIDHCNVK